MITTNYNIEDYVKLDNIGWIWDWKLINKRPTINNLSDVLIYKNTQYNVSLLYTNILNVPKKLGDLNSFTEGELLNYIDIFGMSLIMRMQSEIIFNQRSKNSCKVCTRSKSKIWFFQRELQICDECTKKKFKPTNFIINKRSGSDNIVTGLIENKIDIVFLIGDKLCYCYHSIFHIEKFDYKTILFEPYRQIDYILSGSRYKKPDDILCTRCLRYRRCNNSVCHICFNYSYKITFRFVIEFWLTMDFGLDIMSNIFEKLLHLMKYYSVNFSDIYNNITPKKLLT